MNNALSTWQFPFNLQLNLRPFVEQWRKMAGEDPLTVSPAVRARVEKELIDFPHLLEPNADVNAFAAHQDFLKLLFQFSLPPKEFMNVLVGAVAPFSPSLCIFSTDGYKAAIEPDQGQFVILDMVYSMSRVDARILYAYKTILKKFYNYDLKVEYPIITAVVNAVTGTSRYYKLTGIMQFFDTISLAPLPEIDEIKLQELLDLDFDEKTWMEVLPPQNFLFSGIVFLNLIDVTTEHAITRLENLLVNSLSNDTSWVDQVRLEIQNLLRLQDMHLGMATIQTEGPINSSSQNLLWNCLLPSGILQDHDAGFKGSIYEEVMRTNKTVIIEDLRKQKDHPTLQAFLEAGYHNLILAPILYEDQLIGLLELACPNAGDLTGLALFKINQIRIQFGIAMKRLLEEFDNRVEAVMMQQFTSIHPVVQWRFREAAIHRLENRVNSFTEEIMFEDVYPFFGSLDIRDSSKKRSTAIENDLAYNLDAAYQVLTTAHQQLSFDILGELMLDVEKNRNKLRENFSTGDEIGIADFIRHQVNPVITHLAAQYPQLNTTIQPYIGKLSHGTGLCSLYRNAYEKALNLINVCIVECLDAEEADLQRLYPCYFEKYRTDGVEYNIYAGPSIARGRAFDPLYLDNLRLRQLLWTCDIVSKVEALQPQLLSIYENARKELNGMGSQDEKENKIEIASLILGYSHPITLKFRNDEKRIEVDGSYNVRYAILKKRIDKATILGKPERLTMPGHISIVYAQDQEAAIYERHLGYLLKKGLIYPDWEYLDLEPPQGVEGLRALRAKVKS